MKSKLFSIKAFAAPFFSQVFAAEKGGVKVSQCATPEYDFDIH